MNPGVQLDMATSIGAMGKVAVAFRAGNQMPDGWLIDSEGKPTNDPAVMHAGTFENPGKAGALLPFGSCTSLSVASAFACAMMIVLRGLVVHTADKGWGLSFFCELLGASLIGASTIASKDVPKTTKRVNSMMAIIIDPLVAQADGPGAGLAAEIDDLVAYAKASGELSRFSRTDITTSCVFLVAICLFVERVCAGPGVEIPNEQEQRYEKKRLSSGVSLDAETWRQLTTCAKQLGLSEAELRELEKACFVASSYATKL